MKTLVIYYSYSGNNEVLARSLQEKLNCDLIKIEEIDRRSGFTIFLDILFHRRPDLKTLYIPYYVYSQVIFVAPVWASRIASPLESFLTKEAKHITNYSFITLCGRADEIQEGRISKQLAAISGRKPRGVLELSVNELLASKGMTMKFRANYKVTTSDMKFYQRQLDEFTESDSLLEVL